MDINFEFFSIEPSTIIGVLCNTLILFLIFKKFLFGPVNKIIEERKAQVSKTYDEADQALKKAKDILTAENVSGDDWNVSIPDDGTETLGHGDLPRLLQKLTTLCGANLRDYLHAFEILLVKVSHVSATFFSVISIMQR